MKKSPAFAPAIVTLLIVIVDELELLSVADCAALLDPTVVDAKVRLEGVAEMLVVEPAPIPVRDTNCGLFAALSVN